MLSAYKSQPATRPEDISVAVSFDHEEAAMADLGAQKTTLFGSAYCSMVHYNMACYHVVW